MLKTVKQNKYYIIFDDSLISENIEHCFDAQYWQATNKVIGSAQGRGTTWFIQLNTLQGALRHYRRGGLFGKIISDTYFFTGYETTRSIAEFHLLQHLYKKGVNVPRPIAAKVEKKGLFYQADLLSEKIPDALDLVDLLKQKSLSALQYRQIGQQIRNLHDAQVNHTDLNIHNILIDNNAKVWIIDFDKCAIQKGNDWKRSNLQRLLRSFKKEVSKRAINWNDSDWQYLIEGYK